METSTSLSQIPYSLMLVLVHGFTLLLKLPIVTFKIQVTLEKFCVNLEGSVKTLHILKPLYFVLVYLNRE